MKSGPIVGIVGPVQVVFLEYNLLAPIIEGQVELFQDAEPDVSRDITVGVETARLLGQAGKGLGYFHRSSSIRTEQRHPPDASHHSVGVSDRLATIRNRRMIALVETVARGKGSEQKKRCIIAGVNGKDPRNTVHRAVDFRLVILEMKWNDGTGALINKTIEWRQREQHFVEIQMNREPLQNLRSDKNQLWLILIETEDTCGLPCEAYVTDLKCLHHGTTGDDRTFSSAVGFVLIHVLQFQFGGNR